MQALCKNRPNHKPVAVSNSTACIDHLSEIEGLLNRSRENLKTIDFKRDDDEVPHDENAYEDETMVSAAPKRTCKTTVPQKPEKKSRKVLAPLQTSANSLH